MFAPGSKGFKGMKKRLNRTAKSTAVATAKKMKKKLGRKIKKSLAKVANIRMKGLSRRYPGKVALTEKRLENVVRKNNAFRADYKKTPIKVMRKGNAPYHPSYGFGDRYEFEYAVREIRRTGDSNTSSAPDDGTVGALPTSQNDEVHIFGIETGTNTYRYDQAVCDAIPIWYTGSPTGAMVSSLCYIEEEKGYAVPTCVSDTLKYYENYFTRELIYDYKPTVPKTTTGNIVFASTVRAGAPAVTVLSEYEEKNYKSICGLKNKVETAVCEPCSITLIKPSATCPLSKAVQGVGVEVDSGNDGQMVSATLIGAVDTVLTAGQHDKLGTLVVRWLVDCYSKHWKPEVVPSDSVWMELQKKRALEKKKQSDVNAFVEKMMNENLVNESLSRQIAQIQVQAAQVDTKQSQSASNTCSVVAKEMPSKGLPRAQRMDLEALVKKMRDLEQKEKDERKDEKKDPKDQKN